MKIAPIAVTYIGHFGSDLNIVNAARVSFEKESDWERFSVVEGEVLSMADKKLITYLAKHKHFSPFNHAFLSFRVKAPLYVSRQLVKHKFMPWNEVSRRYVDSEPEFYFPDFYRERGANVKQGSADRVSDYSLAEARNYTKVCLAEYQYRLDCGVCPEQARDALPTNMHTEWIWSGTLGAFADMLKLRLDTHTQKESRDVANLIYEEAVKLFPVSLPSLLENK